MWKEGEGVGWQGGRWRNRWKGGKKRTSKAVMRAEGSPKKEAGRVRTMESEEEGRKEEGRRRQGAMSLQDLQAV
jgi:hypothetical protein